MWDIRGTAAGVRRVTGVVACAIALTLHPANIGNASNAAVPSNMMTNDAARLLPDNSASTRTYVAARASRQGWTVHQWSCAVRLIQRESSWRVNAQNPHSTAYGLFQILNLRPGTPLALQVTRFLRYIEQRYNNDPCVAWSFHLRNGWY